MATRMAGKGSTASAVPPQGPTLTLDASRDPNKIMRTQTICLAALVSISARRFGTSLPHFARHSVNKWMRGSHKALCQYNQYKPAIPPRQYNGGNLCPLQQGFDTRPGAAPLQLLSKLSSLRLRLYTAVSWLTALKNNPG